MKKIKTMRMAAGFLIIALLTTSLIGGTFAKYITSADSNDSARVAYWGFQSSNSLDISDLFSDNYDDSVKSEDEADVIAPGSSGSVTFSFAFDEESTGTAAPEVAYQFTVEVTDSCDDAIKNNEAIEFALDDDDWGTWDDMISALKLLSGDDSGSMRYEAGTLPTEFSADDDEHTIAWRWNFVDSTDQNTADTAMGNAASLAECSISIEITAEQID